MRHISCLTVIIFFSLIALWSLFRFPFFTSHDGFVHSARIAAYYKIIKDGQIPPRWADNLNAGYGSPIFVYSYPLPYFLGSIFHAIKFSYQDSFRLVIILSTLASAITMYFWLGLTFSKIASVVGSIFYIWVPYRFLNIYVRGAFAENLAYTFLPLVFFSGQKRWYGLLALSISGLLLSHNVVAAISLPIIFSWFLLQLAITRNKKHFLKSLFSLILGFCISSFIYIPDLFERTYIHFDRGISYFQSHFVEWWQLINSSWGFGYDSVGSTNDAMSFQLGIAQIVVFCVVSLIFAKQLRRLKTLKNINNKLFLGVFFVAVLLISVFLMIEEPIVRVVWGTLPLFKTVVDFPWRLLGITTFVFSFLTAYLLDVYHGKKALVAALILLVLVMFFNRNYTSVSGQERYTDPLFDAYNGTSTAASDEYSPIWHQTHIFDEQKTDLTILSGNVIYHKIIRNSKQFRFTLTTTKPAEVRINRFYFPKTVITLDGKPLTINRDFKIVSTGASEIEDYTGLIELFVSPPGGLYELDFEETPVRKASNIISLISIIVAMALFYKEHRSKLQV